MIKNFKRHIFLVTLFFLILTPLISHSADSLLKGPWDDSGKVLSNNTSSTKDPKESGWSGFLKSPLRYSLTSAVKFYQYAVSPVIGNRCSMYPSCSHYSLLALKKHGGLIGFAMTVDRLMHESEELRSGPLIEVNGRYLVYDPVENNDFWWNKKELK